MRISNSENICRPYHGTDPYLFVSYSHVDTSRVVHVLRMMARQGIRFWYDEEGDSISAGMDWLEWIDDRLTHSDSFIVFVTNGVENRGQLIRETEAAIDRAMADPSYRVIFILMEQVPLNIFTEKISAFLQRAQFVPMYMYGGMTERFVRRLLGKDVISDVEVDNSVRMLHGLCPWQERSSKDQELEYCMEDLIGDRNYVYPLALPQKVTEKGVTFYKVSPGQTDPGAVYPICMDNQWLPDPLFSDPEFLQQGFTSKRILGCQLQEQKKELYRALLHNWQIIVNRASLHNSAVFSKLYHESAQEYEALTDFLSHGAIVPFLMKEDSPSPAKPPKYGTQDFESWKKLCETTPVYCLRLDWESEESNEMETTKLVISAFQNFCLTAACDEYTLQAIVRALNIPEDREPLFYQCMKSIQKQVTDQKRGSYYSRESFYRNFVVLPGSKVSECRIDPDKKFAVELKRIIDFNYSMNLPNALQLRPLFPASSVLAPVLNAEKIRTGIYREITADEMNCALTMFVPDFLQEKVPMTFRKTEPNLAAVHKLRSLPAWNAYMRAVSAGRRRAWMNELDLYDAATVWQRFRNWMEEAAEKCPEYGWEKDTGTISFLLRMDGIAVTIIYTAGKRKPTVIYPKKKSADYLEKAGAKTALTIDYVCADIRNPMNTDTCLLAELRLLESMTHEPGKTFYRRLKETMARLTAD